MFFAHMTFEALPGARNELTACMKTMMEHARTEPGCVVYTFSADLEHPDRFHIAEVWASLEDLETHIDQPYAAPCVAVFERCMKVVSSHVVAGEVAGATIRDPRTART